MTAALERDGWQARVVPGGKVIWRQGDDAEELGWVISGRFDVQVDGRSVAEIGAEEVLGELCKLADRERRTMTIQALQRSEILVVDRTSFTELAAQRAESYEVVLRSGVANLLDRVKRMQRMTAERQRAHDKMPTLEDFLRSPEGAAAFAPARLPEVHAQVAPLLLQALADDDFETVSASLPIEVLETLMLGLRVVLDETNARFGQLQGPRGNIDLVNPFSTVRRQPWADEGPLVDVSLDALTPMAPKLPDEAEEKWELIRAIREGVVGANEALWTPFGLRRLVYADYTASGRSLGFIEDFIRDEVMPLYANTHTEASATGLQTTHFREEARQIVARCVNASADDAVVFVGSGATAAVNRLVDMLNLRIPRNIDGAPIEEDLAEDERPVVFIGPYEHHSNILPWQHSRAELFIVPLDPAGRLDLDFLETLLKRYQHRRLKIGTFSAASNVTGLETDTVVVAELLHRYGALSFWDFAAAGPYVEIDMNPIVEGVDPALTRKDAIFISPHKFVGGPGTPGLLITKRELDRSPVPTNPGGGTVDFVVFRKREIVADYSDSLEHREESGTPAIIESIRCGLVFHLKELVGASTIRDIETAWVRAAIASWAENPAIDVLGPHDADRLSITSLLIRCGPQYLHHNYVVALLNDLFGIQARGGCSCAGPYGSMLLALNEERGEIFQRCVDGGWESLKPGWTRVNFNYFIGERELRYVVEALHLVALKGWALLPQYQLDPRTGLWTHRAAFKVEPQSLRALQFDGRRMKWSTERRSLREYALDEHLAEARQILIAATRSVPEEMEAPVYDAEFEDNRWFPLPHEIAAWLRARNSERAPLAPEDVFRAPVQAAPVRRGDSADDGGGEGDPSV